MCCCACAAAAAAAIAVAVCCRAQGIQSSFFKQELERWTELDVSQPFAQLFDEVWPVVQSMAQLLHHKDEVVDALLGKLVERNEVAFKPLLALVPVLARDLRVEMYPYFGRTLDVLVALIDPAKPMRTGEVFKTLSCVPPPSLSPPSPFSVRAPVVRITCSRVVRAPVPTCSYLFKYLAPQLLQNLDAVRGYYGPLLGHAKAYVREFAAQSFAFLLRKLPGAGMAKHAASLVRAMGPQVAAADGSPVPPRPRQLRDGVALLVFEAGKGVQHGFHSQMPAVLSAVLAACRPKLASPSDDAGEAPAKAKGKGKGKKKGKRAGKGQEEGAAASAAGEQAEVVYATALLRRFAVVERSVHLMAEHMTRDHSDELWQVLHAELDATMKRVRKVGAPSVWPCGALGSAVVWHPVSGAGHAMTPCFVLVAPCTRLKAAPMQVRRSLPHARCSLPAAPRSPSTCSVWRRCCAACLGTVAGLA